MYQQPHDIQASPTQIKVNNLNTKLNKTKIQMTFSQQQSHF